MPLVSICNRALPFPRAYFLDSPKLIFVFRQFFKFVMLAQIVNFGLWKGITLVRIYIPYPCIGPGT